MSDIRNEKIELLLSDDEVLASGEELARKLSEKERVEERRKLAASGFKEEHEDLDYGIAKLREEVNTRRRDIWVEVRDQRTDETCTIATVRIDTGEIIRTREMTSEERQGKLYGITGRSPDDQDRIDRTPAGS